MVTYRISARRVMENDNFVGLFDTRNYDDLEEKVNELIKDKSNYLPKLKKCNYTKEESLKVGHKKCIGGNNVSSVKIICITTGKQFDAISDGARYYNIKHSCHISDCCKGKTKMFKATTNQI